jgi:dTDP-4-dehydrorhamnose 3,5-epimerase
MPGIFVHALPYYGAEIVTECGVKTSPGSKPAAPTLPPRKVTVPLKKSCNLSLSFAIAHSGLSRTGGTTSQEIDEMKFESLPLAGAYQIHLAPRHDLRGFFARSWCSDTFIEHGIDFDFVQANFSRTRQQGTIRGMHYQRDPFPDAKVVRCTQGRIFEVIADIRPDSPTYGRWWSTVLGEDIFDMVYVPAGCAQGFQSLTNNVVVEYFMSERFRPTYYGGFRYDDAFLGIKWPLPVSVISAQDLGWPALRPMPVALPFEQVLQSVEPAPI